MFPWKQIWGFFSKCACGRDVDTEIWNPNLKRINILNTHDNVFYKSAMSC